jgi:hypothetical protein
MSDDLPTFPDLSELAALWPLWLALVGFFLTWLWSEHMDRRARRWHRMKMNQQNNLNAFYDHVDS